MDKPFPKTPRKIVTIIIEEDGSQTFLKTDSADIFLEQGEVITRRASFVEPGPRYERWLFNLLRTLFSDTSKVAAWTRTWNTLWRVNTRPVGGPILTWADVWQSKGLSPKMFAWGNNVAYWSDRQSAIDAEIEFLNKFFAERTI